MPLNSAAARRIDHALPALLALVAAAFAVHRLFAYDIWWQIRAGAWILEHGIPEVDPFSYAFPAQVWIEPRWLWCVLVFGTFRVLGADGLILLKLALLALTFIPLARSTPRAPGWIVAAGGTLALALAHHRLLVRPELITWAALAFFLWVVARRRDAGSARLVWLLPAVQLVWCNAHALWILGPVTLWMTVAGEWIERRAAPRDATPDGADSRRLALVAATASAVALVNPYFLRGVAFPFQLLREISAGSFVNTAIEEVLGPFSALHFDFDVATVAYLTAIVLSVGAALLNRRQTSIARAVLWFVFLVLSLMAQRNVALFGWVAAWTLQQDLFEYHAATTRPAAQRLAATCRASLATLLLVALPLVVTDRFYIRGGSLKRFGFGVSEQRFPVRALVFARAEGLPFPVLNTLGDGGYVLFEGGERSVYVDGRLEVYGEEAIERAVRLSWSGADLDAEAERTGVRTVLVRNDPADVGLLRQLEMSPDWVAVYFDALHVIYLRREQATAELVDRLAVDWSTSAPHPVPLPAHLAAGWPAPASWWRMPDAFHDERLGSLLVGVGAHAAALPHFERAWARDPGHPRVRLFLGMLRDAAGDAEAARRLHRGLSAAMIDREDTQRAWAAIALGADRPDIAVMHFERALELGAASDVVVPGLARAAIRAGDPRRAEGALETFLRERPDAVEAWNLHAAAAARRGDAEAARERFERSLELQPDQHDVLSALAAIYDDAGEFALATEARERAEELRSGERAGG